MVTPDLSRAPGRRASVISVIAMRWLHDALSAMRHATGALRV